MKEIIKKYDNIIMVGVIVLVTTGITLNVTIADSDELWNFQNIYKMYNGFQIYKDANVIITPLFFWIGEFIFKLIGANFLTFRIYNIIIHCGLYIVIYNFLKKLDISKVTSAIIVFCIILYKEYYLLLGQANYNILALTLFILGVYLTTKKYKYNSFIQGCILFLVFITKQNFGVFYGIGLFIYEIQKNKELKIKIKSLVIEMVTFSVFLASMCIILAIKNNLYNFIDYTMLGITEFAKQNVMLNINNMIITTAICIINIGISTVFIKNKKIDIKIEEKEKLRILTAFSCPLTLVMFPIFNESHFITGILLAYIEFIYIIKIIINNIEIKISNKIKVGMLAIICISMIMNSVYNYILWYKYTNNEMYSYGFEHPFYGAIIEEYEQKEINNVINYIQNSNNKVIVLSSKAALYMVPLKESNGKMDLPFKGNLGQAGEQGVIKEIKEMDNVEILINKENGNSSWQESNLVKEYIKNNLEKIGEIEGFYIYK